MKVWIVMDGESASEWPVAVYDNKEAAEAHVRFSGGGMWVGFPQPVKSVYEPATRKV